jgi:HSP20 family molecular chaperone IbpA
MKLTHYPNSLTDSLFSLIDKGLIYPDHTLFGPTAKSNLLTGDTVRFNSTQESFVVEIDIPGAKREDTQVNITGNEVYITACRNIITQGGHKEETMTRSFTLNKEADMDTVNAKQENGVLTISARRKNNEKHKTKSLRID